jgi:nitrate reductase gamma subunit
MNAFHNFLFGIYPYIASAISGSGRAWRLTLSR